MARTVPRRWNTLQGSLILMHDKLVDLGLVLIDDEVFNPAEEDGNA